MPKIVIPFTILEDDVNLLDGTPYTLVTLPASALVRVPVRLELTKAAGTAYTLGIRADDGGLNTQRSQGFQTLDADRNVTKEGQAFLVVRESPGSAGARREGRQFFHLPMEGFLNSASVTGIVAFPNINDMAFASGETVFEIVATAPISSGTGSLTGRLYFDEYSVV